MTRMLRAGAWTLDLDDRGVLRHVRLGDREVLRGLAGVVRDADWGTVEGVVTVERCEIEENGFSVSFTSVHRGAGVDLAWTGTLTGLPDSTVRMTFDGRATGPTRTNRIGLVALHALDGAGHPVDVIHTDGSVQSSRFPELVAPHQPFLDVAGFRQRTDDGAEIEILFEGDVFETEDQRNWSDASFKTYSRPLSLPFPYPLDAGETVQQSVTLRATGALPPPADRAPRSVTVRVQDEPASWPRLGTGWATGHSRAADAVAALRPAWVRVDVTVDTDGDVTRATALAEAAAAGLTVELALTVSDGAPSAAIVPLLDVAAVDHVLVYSPGAPTTSAAALAAVRALVPAATPVRGGTDGNLAELNRFPPASVGDGVALSINAQVHDDADLAVMQTTEAYPAMIATARHRGDTEHVTVSPVTLRPRRNLYATAAPRPVGDGVDPATIDARQHDPFAAAWTVAVLAALSAAGVADATLFEHAGPRGILRSDGGRTPVADVLAAAFSAGGALRITSDDPSVVGIALRIDDRTVVILANTTDSPRDVALDGIVSMPPRTIAPFDILLHTDGTA
ncbi:hypothetical protein [uncultured Microbacterium sp.]|uniref:hypothetical protein n=1 Tax=uncultured Microbacterium sp. TaxID=191216 RepID=UPI0028DC18D6|nr:hypothetical protein [uncultured Microbacterium sp.]